MCICVSSFFAVQKQRKTNSSVLRHWKQKTHKKRKGQPEASFHFQLSSFSSFSVSIRMTSEEKKQTLILVVNGFDVRSNYSSE